MNTQNAIVKNRLYYAGDCNPNIHGFYFWLDSDDCFNVFKCGENSGISYSVFISEVEYDSNFTDKLHTVDDVLDMLYNASPYYVACYGVFMLKCDIEYTNVDMQKIENNLYIADGMGNNEVEIKVLNSNIKSWHNVFKKYMGFSASKKIHVV